MHQRKEPYHILRLTPHFYWPQLAATGWPVKFDAIGGMQTQIYRQTLALSSYDLRQTVMTLRMPRTEACWCPADGVTVEGVRVPILPIRSRIRGMVDLNASWCLGVIQGLIKQQRRFDLVHAHCSGVFWPLSLALLVSRWLDIPMVITIHCSLHSTYHAMSKLDEALLPFSRLVERLAIANAACTIVLTPRTLMIYEGLGLTKGRNFAVIPDSINTDAFREFGTEEHERAFVQRFSIPDDVLCVTSLGRIAHEKGWRNVINLAKALDDLNVKFLVCGDGNERHTLEKMINDAGLRDRFVITGYLGLEEVPGALRRANVLVLSSIHEEFGGVILEAMAMEKPVVAFRVGGIPTVVEDGITGRLVTPGDIEAMTQAVREILTNPTLAKKLGTRGAAQVRERFSLEASCRKLHDIYQEILETYENRRNVGSASWARSSRPEEVARVAHCKRSSEFAE